MASRPRGDIRPGGSSRGSAAPGRRPRLQVDADLAEEPRREGIRLATTNRNVFEDSVRPVIDSGQADIWSDTHQIGRQHRLATRGAAKTDPS
jgi:hypothetical protein